MYLSFNKAAQAIEKGDAVALKQILDEDAQFSKQHSIPSITSYYMDGGMSLLGMCIKIGNPNILKVTLDIEGPNVLDNYSNLCSKNFPLHQALYHGNPSSLVVLLEYGADPSKQNGDGETALVYCNRLFNTPSERQNNKAIYWLQQLLLSVVEERPLENPKDINYGAATFACTLEVDTPLTLAARYGCVKIISKLVSAGADVNKYNLRGETPLIVASDLNTLQTLHQQLGADINCKGGIEYTALDLWVNRLKSDKTNNALEICKYLVTNGATTIKSSYLLDVFNTFPDLFKLIFDGLQDSQKIDILGNISTNSSQEKKFIDIYGFDYSICGDNLLKIAMIMQFSKESVQYLLENGATVTEDVIKCAHGEILEILKAHQQSASPDTQDSATQEGGPDLSGADADVVNLSVNTL
ncbi:MAG UNVERIFIED_CONTAM: ankyrin repeat domain-containing protein [Planctomycetaceae bacterium]|jgi:ankyrin repeat protein